MTAPPTDHPTDVTVPEAPTPTPVAPAPTPQTLWTPDMACVVCGQDGFVDWVARTVTHLHEPVPGAVDEHGHPAEPHESVCALMPRTVRRGHWRWRLDDTTAPAEYVPDPTTGPTVDGAA